MVDWKDNVVKYDWTDAHVHPAIRYPSVWISGASETIDAVIGLVDSFNPRRVTPKDVINSLSDHNQGFVSKPAEYYIDITTKPFGEGYEMLLACQNGDRYFDIILAPAEQFDAQLVGNAAAGLNSAWKPGYEVFIGCKVLDNSERYAMGVVPTVTFSCRALRFVWGEGQDAKKFGDGLLGRQMTDAKLGLT